MGTQSFIPVLKSIVVATAMFCVLQPRAVKADELRFAVVNLSGASLPQTVVASVEREVQRLRPGTQLILEDPVVRLLETGETPEVAAPRLVAQAEAARASGDCALALNLGNEAEMLLFGSVATATARPLLIRVFTTALLCSETLSQNETLILSARRLKAMTDTPPEGFPQASWDAHVATLVEPTESTELFIDSEPANAQISVNFRAVGTTPHTLKVSRGEVLIELEKEGYKKSFRRLELLESQKRTVFRLIGIRADRAELIGSALNILSRVTPTERPQVLSQLAQWARADLLVLLKIENGMLRIWQFDADRGAAATEVIDSTFDPESGRVAALAERKAAGEKRAGLLSPGKPGKENPDLSVHADDEEGLPTTFAKQRYTGIKKTHPPWWSYIVATAVVGIVVGLVIADQPRAASDLDITATWNGP
jgi:PEGA domain